MWIAYRQRGPWEWAQLSPSQMLVGRGSDAHLRLKNDTVSVSHLWIWHESGRVCIRDENSTNGTCVAGQPEPISRGEWREIRPQSSTEAGDLVRLGDYEMMVVREPLVAPRGGSEFPRWPSLDGPRYCYLRKETLGEALRDERVLDAVVGTKCEESWRTLKGCSMEDRRTALLQKAEHEIRMVHGRWNNPEKPIIIPEVLAAWILECAPEKRVYDLFFEREYEDNLTEHVVEWLEKQGWEVYDQVSCGGNTIDLVAVDGDLQHVIAIELKNAYKELKDKAPSQLTAYCDYANEVYLGCTPRLAAEYVRKHAEKSGHWDADMLNHRVVRSWHSGLLLVEGPEVYLHKSAPLRRKEIEKNKTSELRRVLAGK